MENCWITLFIVNFYFYLHEKLFFLFIFFRINFTFRVCLWYDSEMCILGTDVLQVYTTSLCGNTARTHNSALSATNELLAKKIKFFCFIFPKVKKKWNKLLDRLTAHAPESACIIPPLTLNSNFLSGEKLSFFF